jgi:hypothetical protein
MAVIITPDSELGKEMAKWEKPYTYQHFPFMLYQARRAGSGGQAEASITCTVNSEIELENQLKRGFFKTGAEAIAALERAEDEHSEQTARRHYGDRKLSQPAQAEALEEDRAAGEHLPEIPEAPAGKGGKGKAGKSRDEGGRFDKAPKEDGD